MKKEDIEEVRKIFDTQIANGERVIKLNAPMFKELLEHAETYNSIVRYGGKLEVGYERNCELVRMDNQKIELVDCEVCGGGGFSKTGTGYDSVCDNCGGLGEYPNY